MDAFVVKTLYRSNSSKPHTDTTNAFREHLCETDGATWRKQSMHHLADSTDFVPLNWHDLARHIVGIAGTKFVPV